MRDRLIRLATFLVGTGALAELAFATWFLFASAPTCRPELLPPAKVGLRAATEFGHLRLRNSLAEVRR